MKATGVIIGTGPWRDEARITADLAQSNTGIPFVVLDQLIEGPSHPSWMKCWVPELVDSDLTILMDADVIPLRKFDPVALLGDRDFVAAHDTKHPCVSRVCEPHNLDPDAYVNGGLFIFNRRGADVLREARKLHDHWDHPFWEQTPVNIAMSLVQLKKGWIPRVYNQCQEIDHLEKELSRWIHCVNLHALSLRNDIGRFQNLRRNILELIK